MDYLSIVDELDCFIKIWVLHTFVEAFLVILFYLIDFFRTLYKSAFSEKTNVNLPDYDDNAAKINIASLQLAYLGTVSSNPKVIF